MKTSLRLIAAFVAVTLAVLGSAKKLPIDEDPGNSTPIRIPPPADSENPIVYGSAVPAGYPVYAPNWCSVCYDYVLVGADSSSNAYNGDTSTTQVNKLLCIAPQGLPAPVGLPPPVYTPGGALKNSWSGGKLFIVPDVRGTDLTSEAVADNICANYGAKNGYPTVTGARMAEFHDGQNGAGWGFWGEKHNLGDNFDGRLWVKINDQNSNPWSNGGGVRLALTFVKKAIKMLCTQ